MIPGLFLSEFSPPAHHDDQLSLYGVKDMLTTLMARYLVISRNIYRFIRITSVETEVLSVGSMKIRLLSDRMQDLVLWYTRVNKNPSA